MKLRKQLRVQPGGPVELSKRDPGQTFGWEKSAVAKHLEQNSARLAALQLRLFAEGQHALLIILQGMDASGKDGTVRHVMSGINPASCRVHSFKVPTAEEAHHDYLWRIHHLVPARGEIGIFNRSHYEDVLVTRVHKLIDKPTCQQRYQRIREFEDLLAENGTQILKFYLHISKQEQLARFAERLEDPARNWKISESDYSERALWDDYTAAFEDAITATSTKAAPWYVIPANHKWFRNLAVSRIIAETMEGLQMSYPKPTVDLADIRQKYHMAVQAEKGGGKSK